MNFDITKLYDLLPALYRIRDTELAIKMLTPEQRQALGNLPFLSENQIDGPIKALLSIIADQIAVLEENLDQLYDDQFIETCAEWVVPYIGQLVGSRGLLAIPDAPFSERGEVANTIAYRRRKGTASVIEQLAHDVTDWNSNVVEYFQRLATTQYMNHLRPENLGVSGVKNWEILEYAKTPFSKMTHTVDVRRIEKKRGKYNIPNIGIFLWRLKGYTLEEPSPAFKIDARRYTFDALGKSKPLYNKPQTEKNITHLAEPINVPIPLSRRVLSTYFDTYFGENKSLVIYLNGQTTPLPTTPNWKDSLSICNLSDVLDSGGNIIGWANMPTTKIAIDPVLGRIAFPSANPAPTKVMVKFYTAFSADMGGGGYERESTFTKSDNLITVKASTGTIQTALNQLFTLLQNATKTVGVIEIKDNENYPEDLVIKIPKGKTIEIRAADKFRPVLVLNAGIKIEAEANTTLIFNGLVITKGPILSKAINKLHRLRFVHCTLTPDVKPKLTIESPNLQVEIEKSIVGPMRIIDGVSVQINNSIVDATDPSQTAYSGRTTDKFGGVLHVQNTTFIGMVNTTMMEMASNCIFYAIPPLSKIGVKTQRLQQGCVRFSYFPLDSKIPRPYRCQPATRAMAARVQPMFTSLIYGDAAYCQLATACAVEITEGSDDASEMGAFHHLYQPQRVANLRTRLNEYLRFGLEAGIFFAS